MRIPGSAIHIGMVFMHIATPISTRREIVDFDPCTRPNGNAKLMREEEMELAALRQRPWPGAGTTDGLCTLRGGRSSDLLSVFERKKIDQDQDQPCADQEKMKNPSRPAP